MIFGYFLLLFTITYLLMLFLGAFSYFVFDVSTLIFKIIHFNPLPLDEVYSHHS